MGITERMHQVRGHLVAWGLQRVQDLCVRLARGYQWRVAGQGESEQMAHAVLASVYTHGVLRGISRGTGCAVSDVRAAIQESEPQLQWSSWLFSLARASYAYGALLLVAHEADSLITDGIPVIF